MVRRKCSNWQRLKESKRILELIGNKPSYINDLLFFMVLWIN